MKKILVSTYPWETRVAILDGNILQNIYLTSHAVQHLERCFFKGVVTKVLPGTQSAFVDINQERAGFLHISEVDRDLAINRMFYGVDLGEEGVEEKKETVTRSSMDIGKILTEGEALLVQVSKEPVYEKGAKLTTCFTLPGRFLVLMPKIPRIGISKKIENREERTRLREIFQSLLPEGMGAIIRTSAEKREPTDLSKDVTYLLKIWASIQEKYKNAERQEKIHEDLPLALQVIRDNIDDNVEQIIVNSPDMQKQIHQFIKEIAPEFSHHVKLYSGQQDLFEKYNVNKQIDNALQKKVSLESGGSIIIESTEAMTVVDVNTGKYTGKSNLEETIFQTNFEAARTIVRQLRLRNIGGLIVIDFIDMLSGSNKQKLFKFLEQELKEQDKFQSVVLKISEFGLVQMTRKRSGKTLVQQLTQTCTNCHGAGFTKSIQTVSYTILRDFDEDLRRKSTIKAVTLKLNEQIFNYITSVGYDIILQLEKKHACKITLLSSQSVGLESYQFETP